MKIQGVEIGSGHPCRTNAELSNSHNCSLDRAKRMITAAKDAGADFVKTQCFLPSELVEMRGDGPAPEPWGSDGYTMASLYARAQTPHEWFPDLVEHAREVGIPWFSSVFGLSSLALLESLDCPAYKVSAIDAKDEYLGKWVAASGKPIVRSQRPPTSGQDWCGKHAEFRMLCPAGYPQVDAELRHLRVGHTSEHSSYQSEPWFQGYSYHGTSSETPALAALCGAKLIEVHFQLEQEPSELEADVSLNESQFAGMVGRIRHYEGLL